MTISTDRVEPPRIDLGHDGVDEPGWAPTLASLPECDTATLFPTANSRLVVVAPHPDDETLGVGGLIASATAAGREVLVVSVTDGEAAPVVIDDLAGVRRAELDAAVGVLAPGAQIERLGLPDGGLAALVGDVADGLGSLLRRDDVVVAPCLDDGHPDHDACGRASVMAAAASGAACWTYPVWAWHWHDPATSPIGGRGQRFPLSAAAAHAKAVAIACYSSQLESESPVVPPSTMARHRRPFEVLLRA